MQAIRGFFYRFSVAGELLSFLWQRKLWWLIPMVCVLLLIGFLIIFAQVTGVGPFIYALF